MFGKKKVDPPVVPVRWDTAGGFVVGEVVRPSAFRKKGLVGRRAVRMPVTLDGERYFAAAAFVEQRDLEVRSYELHDATEAGKSLLCTVEPASGGRGGEHYQVRDQAGRELGLVFRTPAAKRAVQHGWWLRQPGHPDVVARYHWAKGSTKEIAARGADATVRGAGSLVGSVVDSVLYGDAASDNHSPARPTKPVTWRADDEVALTAGHTQGIKLYVPQASWLDRRLAFALAVLRQD